jgi:hypothetical protein
LTQTPQTWKLADCQFSEINRTGTTPRLCALGMTLSLSESVFQSIGKRSGLDEFKVYFVWFLLAVQSQIISH